MPLELQIVNVREFMRFGAHGKLDWRESLSCLGKIARACAQRKQGRALLDVRDARSNLTGSQLKSLVTIFHDAGFRDRHRIAVLHRRGPTPRAKLFVATAANNGWDARCFHDFEEAVSWLVISDETDADTRPQGSQEPAPPPKD